MISEVGCELLQLGRFRTVWGRIVGNVSVSLDRLLSRLRGIGRFEDCMPFVVHLWWD